MAKSKGYGSELKIYRQNLIQRIINDQTICELVLRRLITDMDDDTISTEMLQHVFRFRKVPKVAEIQTTYITMFIQGRKSSINDVYKRCKIYVYIFSHEDIIDVKISEVGAVGSESRKRLGYLRTDLIDERIEDLFNGYRDLGSMGVLKLVNADDLYIGDGYHGRQLEFETTDLNEGT